MLPDGVDDPTRPSGGNHYDRRVRAALTAAGWQLHVEQVPGSWPRPASAALDDLAAVLRKVPDDATVLVDGLVASPSAGVLVPESARLRVVVLVHMPLGGPEERAVLEAAAAVITTSRWTGDRLRTGHGLTPERLHVARPGVDLATPAPGTEGGGELLCVAVVTPGKGYDVLVRALARVVDLPWRCCCVGSEEVDPAFAQYLSRLADELGVSGRLTFPGALTGDALAARYAAADLLVLASRGETYGMVVVEALAHGVPVLATEVGGIPEALGTSPAGAPGLLVPADDPVALATALRDWFDHPALRARLRQAARARRATLSGWADTAGEVARVLASVAGGTAGH